MYNIDLFHDLFPDNSFYYNLPTIRKVGGVGIYVKSSFPHSVIDNYRIKSDDEVRFKIYGLRYLKIEINILLAASTDTLVTK